MAPMGSPLPREGRVARAYPRRAEINRAVTAARDVGIAVNGVEVAPDGTIRITSGRPEADRNSNEFDRWDAAGRL